MKRLVIEKAADENGLPKVGPRTGDCDWRTYLKRAARHFRVGARVEIESQTLERTDARKFRNQWSIAVEQIELPLSGGGGPSAVGFVFKQGGENTHPPAAADGPDLED